jgi:hypothetical protein
MPPPAPKKSSATEKKTAQTGLMPELDYVGSKNITPKKGVAPEEDYDEENVKTVDISGPSSKEEIEIGSRQEKVERDLEAARGKGRKSRKNKKSKKSRKTRKVKKHGKRKH